MEGLLSSSDRLERDEAETVCAGQEAPYEVALNGPKYTGMATGSAKRLGKQSRQSTRVSAVGIIQISRCPCIRNAQKLRDRARVGSLHKREVDDGRGGDVLAQNDLRGRYSREHE